MYIDILYVCSYKIIMYKIVTKFIKSYNAEIIVHKP